MPETEKLLFNIPRCYITAEFIKYNKSKDKWRYCLINNNDNKKKLVTRSLNNNIMAKVIEELIKKPNSKGNFKKSYKILKDKVEAMKKLETFN